MLISNAMIESNDGGKPYMKVKRKTKPETKIRMKVKLSEF